VREWQQRVQAATAAVCLARGVRPAGTAVLIEAGRLLTCRHVLVAAGPILAGRRVWVTFPGTPPVEAVVHSCADGVDAVVLDLPMAGDASWLPRPVLLSGSARQPAVVEVFGYPAGDSTGAGVWRRFDVVAPVGGGLYQVNWIDAGTLPGHSGGPVVDVGTGWLVGLLTAGSEKGRFDRYLPLTALRDCGLLQSLPWLVEGDDALGHFTRRSRGHRGQDAGGSVFTGRAAALAQIRDWLAAEQAPGEVLVVTGQPGAGKSAVLARAGLDLAGELRQSGDWRGLLFHARQATAVAFRAAVADLAGAADDTTAGRLIETADEAARACPDVRWVIAVDGLDEARTAEDRHQMAALLTMLAPRPWVRAAVATRWLAASPFAHGSLLRELGVSDEGADNVIFLDSPKYFLEVDLAAFSGRLLEQQGVTYPPPPSRAWTRYRDDPGLRDRLAAAVALRAGSNFLVAALASSRLAEAADVHDPRAPGFDPARLPASIGSALDDFLDARDGGALLRGLLTALAYAQGSGFDDRTWQESAVALGYRVTQADVDALRRGRVADYLLQATTGTGGIVTRVFHQALVEQLLVGRDHRQDHDRITTALLDGVRRSLSGWETSGSYLHHHLAYHAAEAGRLAEFFGDIDYLLRADLADLNAHADRLPASKRPALAWVTQRAGHRGYPLPPDRRAGLFSVTAMHHGLTEQASAFARHSTAPLVPRWAHGLGPPHHVVTSGNSGVFSVTALTLPSGRTLLASAGEDGTVRLWDPFTATPAGEPMRGHDGQVLHVAPLTLPSGQSLLASAGEDGTVRLWDPATGTQARDFKAVSGGPVWSLAAAQTAGNTPVLATAGEDGTIWLWDPVTGRPSGEALGRHPGGVRAMTAFTDAGGRPCLASAGKDATVRRWDMRAREPIGEALAGHTGPLGSLAALPMPDGTVVLASGGEDRAVLLWDASTGALAGGPLMHPSEVFALAPFSPPDGRILLATGDHYGTIRLWNPAQGTVEKVLTGHTGFIWSLAPIALPDGRCVLASSGNEGVLRLWEPAVAPSAQDAAPTTPSGMALATIRTPSGHVALASANLDGTIRLWDPATGTPISQPITAHTGTVEAVANVPMPDGRTLLATAGEDHSVRLWDLAMPAPAGGPMTGHTDMVFALAAVPLHGGRTLLASAGRDRDIRLWDPVSGALVGDPMSGHASQVVYLAAIHLADGRNLLASASTDYTVRLWDPAQGIPVGSPLAHTDRVWNLATTRLDNGRTLLASAGFDNTVRLWDPDAATAADKPLPHPAWVYSVAFFRLPGGPTCLATGDCDGTIRLWNPETRTPISLPLDLPEGISSITPVDTESGVSLAIVTGNALLLLDIDVSRINS